jgi:S1-C subfamily serine protease
MVEPGSPLLAFSEHAAELVERAAGSIVAVHGGGHRPLSGIHWRSGVIVTAEEALECDENIKLTLPAGRVADASLAGRDPTTDVAVLRFQPAGLPVATTADASLRAKRCSAPLTASPSTVVISAPSRHCRSLRWARMF